MSQQSKYISEITQRLTYLTEKIDPRRGPSSAMVREARAIAWALDELSRKHSISPVVHANVIAALQKSVRGSMTFLWLSQTTGYTLPVATLPATPWQ